MPELTWDSPIENIGMIIAYQGKRLVGVVLRRDDGWEAFNLMRPSESRDIRIGIYATAEIAKREVAESVMRTAEAVS